MTQQLNKVNHAALDALRKQRIITNPRDLVLYTMLENHPSLNKPDDVVYVYEHVMDQFKYNRMRNVNLLHPIVVTNQQNVINYDEVNLMADILDNNNNNNNQQLEENPEYGFPNIETNGYGSNHNGGYDSY